MVNSGKLFLQGHCKVTGAAGGFFFHTTSAGLPDDAIFLYYLREPPRNIASGIILAVHGSTGPPIYRFGGSTTDAQLETI